ncbi:MAG: DUF721 domain-containing protein [bacterium]|nr:DUF721 domain-containing protein [Candidatus Minthenecus merdequi]
MEDRFADTMSLGEILPKIMGDVVGVNAMEGLRAIRVVETWRNVLGSTMGRYSSKERFERGVLYASIQLPALRQELFMNRTSIIKKINEQMGIDIVKSLILR